MESTDVYIVTLSKHQGIQMKAHRTFEEAWAVAAEAVKAMGGKVLHTSAKHCYEAHNSELVCFTDNWKVGITDSDHGAVGPTMIFKCEL